MLFRKILFLLSLGLFTNQVIAQYTIIEIANSNGDDFLSEPYICFNSENPDIILVGSNLAQIFISNDGAYNWNNNQSLSNVYGIYGDPYLICDTAGNFYYFHLSDPGEPGGDDWIDRVVCQKSEDNGQTWEAISFVGLNGFRKNDNEAAVYDRANNRIYICWTQADAYHSANSQDSSIIYNSFSDNNGITWSEPYRLSKKAGSSDGGINMLRSAVPSIGPNGEVYVAWAGRNEAEETGIIFDKSLDGGISWLDEDIFVSNMPGGSQFSIPGIYQQSDGTDPGTGWPHTVCDTSGSEYHGTIYIAWADLRNGSDDSDIWISKSSDGGDSWIGPIRVNDDPLGSHQFFPAIAIDQTNGNIYLLFYDRRNHTDNATDVYLAISKDGGQTFSNIKINETPFTPNDAVFFGDYIGIIAHDDMVRPVWTELEGAVIGIFTAIIEAPSAIVNTEYDILDASSYPNPVKNEIYCSFKVLQKSIVSISFCDLYGRELNKLVNKKEYSPGKYVESFNTDIFLMNDGLFLLKFRINDKHITKKIILSK